MNDELIERALRGEATREELEALLAWRRASPEHERRYTELARLLEVTHLLRSELRATTPPTAAEVLHRARAAAPGPPTRRRTWLGWSGAAAAGLVLAFVAGSRLLNRNAGDSGAEIVTGVSEMTTVQLRDGSVVRLGPASRLVIGARPDGRDVSLDGRAFFAVAPAKGRPFRVRTRLGDARVLGTRFELATGEDNLALVVVEGRVALDAPANTVEVRGGQASYVARGTATAPVAVANPDSTLRWIGKFVVFQSTPLRDAAREVGRTYGIELAITDSVLAAQTVTATFTDQSAARVVGVLCSVVNARCTTVGDTVIMSRR
jgi:transmembrane sensor